MCFAREGNKGEAFTCKSLFPSFLQSYSEEVKAKKTKNSGRARVGAEVGGRCTFEKSLLVVGGALQGSDEPYLLRKIKYIICSAVFFFLNSIALPISN